MPPFSVAVRVVGCVFDPESVAGGVFEAESVAGCAAGAESPLPQADIVTPKADRNEINAIIFNFRFMVPPFRDTNEGIRLRSL